MAHYKHIIIGSGQAGVPLAHYLSGKGEDTLLIEKGDVGGTCVNTGCTPSKTMHEAIRKIHHARHCEYAGYTVERENFDFPELMNHVRKMRDSWREGSIEGIQNAENLTLMRGHGRMENNNTVSLTTSDGNETSHTADFIYINTGGRPNIPDIKGLEDITPLTNLNVFDLTRQPDSLLIIGGGYIGLEFAQMFARIGTKVTVVNQGEKPISREDGDMIEQMQEMLEKEGIIFKHGANPASVSQTSTGLLLTLKSGEKLEAEQLLLAAGRIPNTDQLSLENTDVKIDDKGIIEVDEVLQTDVHHIYAMGEVAGTPQFTHMSYDDYRIIKANIEKPKVRNNLHRTVPYTLFTDPQLASFGLNEKAARQKGMEYKLYEMPMSSVARAAEKNEPFGKIKVLCNPKTEEILGATLIGVDAGEMMTVLQMASSGGITAPQLRDYIFAHPLLAEGFNNLFTS